MTMSSIEVRVTANENPADRSPVDTAWLVLEAANDLGDDATVEACRRVIDASLSGAVAPQSDLLLVMDYFR
jgi:mannose/cellobiose epimerase-like protein (N-acyl-D-glucosamine 2-epimerase family)